jgi:bacterioferritin-associated ferredoxin
VLCPCEDVLVEDLEEAVELGYTDLEPIKRVTAVTTGPCQGRWCLRATIELLAEMTDRSAEELGSITHRQPVKPVPLDTLAEAPTPEEPEDGDP